LMYFTNEGRINVFEIEIQFSDWLELSENRSARSNAGAAAAERIKPFMRALEKSFAFA